MAGRTIQILHSLGCKVQPSSPSIIDLRQTTTSSASSSSSSSSDEGDNNDDDDQSFIQALLEESRDAAIETYGAASFTVGNVSDDTEIEDIGVLLPHTSADKPWEALVHALTLDLSAFEEPKMLACTIDDGEAGLIKGSKLYNLLSGLEDLRKVTAATRDDAVLLVAWIGKRRATGTVVALLGATETT
ncbi:hypothetical protein QFC20_002522 [Naganishia adeliensis]|uniref:Uncharacterized protein n=1 Tax=Naganishia adeliensis TaxID=92952 RepID=A0ACC2WIQ0_9TREE|nr:hypothetical protein QFC20_002522 [Naganishia adeliensis]